MNVILGWFSWDSIEKCFEKLQQGSGGTYFIIAKLVIKKVCIQHAKLVLQLNIDIEGNDGHDYLLCLEDLDDREIDIIYNLADLEDSINKKFCILLSILLVKFKRVTLKKLVMIQLHIMKNMELI